MSETSNSFNTMDVRPWDKPQLLNSKPISDSSSHSASFPMGINWLDLDRSGKIAVNAYAAPNPNGGTTSHLDSLGNAVLYSAGSTWLNLCENDRDFQFGTFSTEGKPGPWSVQIKFDKSYVTAPKVVVWFKEFDFENNRNWRLQASAENVTATGFTLKLSTWSDTILNKAAVTWIAHASNRSNITSGTFDTREFRPWSEPKLDNKKNVKFDKPFECAPSVYCGLNLMDIDFGKNPRLKAYHTEVTAQGMTLHLDSWFDTIQYASRADYIAIQDF